MHPPLTRLYDEAGSLLAVLFPMLLAFLIAIVFSGCVAQYQKAEMEEEREIAQVWPTAPIYAPRSSIPYYPRVATMWLHVHSHG